MEYDLDVLEYDQWEYDIKSSSTVINMTTRRFNRYLNIMGNAGWELVTMNDRFIIFKRRIHNAGII